MTVYKEVLIVSRIQMHYTRKTTMKMFRVGMLAGLMVLLLAIAAGLVWLA